MMTSPATFRFTLTAAHRVIDRVHHHSADMRSASLPARASRFAARNVHVIDVANLSDCRKTILVNSAHLTRRHFYQRITSFEVV